MITLYNDMSDKLLNVKLDYLTFVCSVTPLVEYQTKENISNITKLAFAKWFNGKEQFKNGVFIDQIQSHQCWLKIQACPASGKGHKIRISFNYDNDAGLQLIALLINKYVPIGWSGVLQTGVVTRLDIAVDLRDVLPHNFLWISRHNYKKSVIHTNDSLLQLESVYLGSVDSDYVVIVYDRGAAKKVKGKESSLPPTSIPDYEVTRIEMRHRTNQPLTEMASIIDHSLSLVHIMKAKFINPASQQRLEIFQKLGSQRYLLRKKAAHQLLAPNEQATLANSITKASLLDLTNGFPCPLTSLCNFSSHAT